MFSMKYMVVLLLVFVACVSSVERREVHRLKRNDDNGTDAGDDNGTDAGDENGADAGDDKGTDKGEDKSAGEGDDNANDSAEERHNNLQKLWATLFGESESDSTSSDEVSESQDNDSKTVDEANVSQDNVSQDNDNETSHADNSSLGSQSKSQDDDSNISDSDESGSSKEDISAVKSTALDVENDSEKTKENTSKKSESSPAEIVVTPNQTTTVATPRPTREPEKCFIEPNLKTFCQLPDDFEDISLWELSAIAFADSVIDELLINCKRGEWCLSKERFDEWDALIAERAEMVMKSQLASNTCKDVFQQCLLGLPENYKECDSYSQMVYAVKSLALICKLKKNPKLSVECYERTLQAIHVTLADTIRENNKDEDSKESEEDSYGLCDSPSVQMTKGLICVANTCPSEGDAFRSFDPWSWFTNEVDYLVEECNLDTTVCEALLQVGTTSIPPSSTFAPESQTTLFQSNSTSENDIITTSSTSGEGMMNMTDTMKDGNMMSLYDGDVKVMVGISVVSMISMVMLMLVGCTFWRRYRRNVVLKEGYEKLLNEGDES